MLDVTFDWSILLPYWRLYADGLGVTLELAAAGLGVSLVVGFGLALMSRSRLIPLQVVSGIYVWLLRAIPIYVFLLWTYFGLSLLIHVNFSAIQAGLLCLGAQYAAYQSEAFRAGLDAVPKGQIEAAESLGMSKFHVYSAVIFPQVIRIVLPTSGNNLVSIVKDTSLVALIGVYEITRYTQVAIAETFRVFEFYSALAAIYVAAVLILSVGVTALERRFAIPGM